MMGGEEGHTWASPLHPHSAYTGGSGGSAEADDANTAAHTGATFLPPLPPSSSPPEHPTPRRFSLSLLSRRIASLAADVSETLSRPLHAAGELLGDAELRGKAAAAVNETAGRSLSNLQRGERRGTTGARLLLPCQGSYARARLPARAAPTGRCRWPAQMGAARPNGCCPPTSHTPHPTPPLPLFHYTTHPCTHSLALTFACPPRRAGLARGFQGVTQGPRQLAGVLARLQARIEEQRMQALLQASTL